MSQAYECRVCKAVYVAVEPDIDPEEMRVIKTQQGPKITVEWECKTHPEKPE